MLTLIIFILVLGVLILVHELGHFIAAKRNGLTVEEFGFGFPPRIFGIKKVKLFILSIYCLSEDLLKFWAKTEANQIIPKVFPQNRLAAAV